jgi:serine/threonine protein kinase
MITGRPPYTGDSIPALCASLLNDVPTSMRSLRADVPPELEDVIQHCLAKDRADRYGTVSELARALAQFGSISSQLHVDRASRVLGVTDLSPFSDSSDRRLSRSADASGQARALSAQRATPARGTVDSWGRTDSPITGDATTAKAKSRGLVLAMLGIAVAAAAGLVLFLGNRSPGTPPSASASVAAPSPPLHSLPAQLDPPAHVAPVAPAVPEPVVSPSAAAPDPTAPVVRPQEPGIKPKPATPVPAAVFRPRPTPATPKAPPSNDLSDFGGRR